MTRYGMTSRQGYYVEHPDRAKLEAIRAKVARFRYAHISRAFPDNDPLILPGRIYPPWLNTAAQFRRFNVTGR